MRLIDLTLEIPKTEHGKKTSEKSIKEIVMPDKTYSGVIYDLGFSSMSGTYIDFPGHIAEFDDGFDSANYPLKRLFDVETAVIRLDRAKNPGKIQAEELEAAGIEVPEGGGLLVHTLGEKEFYEVEANTIYFSKDAVDWIVSKKVSLFISDEYENHKAPEGIFVELFKNGIIAICQPVNLSEIKKDYIRITALPYRIPGVTQLPCRLVAREE